MPMKLRIRTITGLFTLATVVYAFKTKRSHGRFIFVPFEFRVPTIKRVRERLWNSETDTLFTPSVFGVGWSLNLHAALKRLGFLGPEGESSSPTSNGDR